MNYIKLAEIEEKYKTTIENIISRGETLTPELLVDLSIHLFNEWKVKGSSDTGDESNDMLLFQYGVSNWRKDHDKVFDLNVTRQLMTSEDEPYQLSISLLFSPEEFENLPTYHGCWHDEYPNIGMFMNEIHSSAGYKAAMKNTPISYEINFDQV